MIDKGLLVILSGPSGAGKGSVRQRLEQRRDVVYGVSATTRPPREGEEDGVHYFFLDDETFQDKLDNDEFVEWAQVYGHYYGTPREPMESLMAEGQDVILEKDIQGALTLKQVYPEAVYVFILPPSLRELQRRIKRRNTESPEVMKQRLASATDEIKYMSRYDYVVTNDDLDEAVACLDAIITGEKCRVDRMELDTLVEETKNGS